MLTDKDLEDLKKTANVRAYAVALVVVSRIFSGIYTTQAEAVAELKNVFNIEASK
jgi:hypothetical protein